MKDLDIFEPAFPRRSCGQLWALRKIKYLNIFIGKQTKIFIIHICGNKTHLASREIQNLFTYFYPGWDPWGTPQDGWRQLKLAPLESLCIIPSKSQPCRYSLIHPFIYLFLSVCQSIYPSVCQSVCLSACMSVCLLRECWWSRRGRWRSSWWTRQDQI